MRFDYDRIGTWTAEDPFTVTADRVRAYAAATNDEVPLHRSGALAPPIFAVVPPLQQVLSQAVWGVALSEREGYDTRNLHGEQDIAIEQPILPGMRLRSRGAVVGVQPKSTGTLVVTRTESQDQSGRLVNVQHWTNFIRGVTAPRAEGESPPGRGLPPRDELGEALAVVSHHVDADQTYRYAEASGDHGTYHLDEAAAREAGLPGIIVHGLCTMAFASRALVHAAASDDPRRLKRIAVRFTRPLRPGQDVTTTVWSIGARDGRQAYTFEMVDGTGQAVLTRGLAEMSV
jgi:acyl dehydratase